MDLKARAKALKTDIPAVLMALRHPKTPWYAKACALLIVVYALSPIDLIPDFIPVLGYLDDLIILPALVALTIHWIPVEVMQECRLQAAQLGRGNWQKKWIYAIPFLLVWFLVLFFLGVSFIAVSWRVSVWTESAGRPRCNC